MVRQSSFSSAEVFSLQWSEVATSEFSKLGQFQFGFPSTDSFRHEWNQRDFSFREFLTGNFSPGISTPKVWAQGKLKKSNSETQRGAIFPSSFLNRSECRGSIRWQSSWATTCSMNASPGWRAANGNGVFPKASSFPNGCRVHAPGRKAVGCAGLRKSEPASREDVTPIVSAGCL